ncbi:unnamed protein product [Prorocentrum cordatum]|uniref:Major facilitator superfamily (MFS) profile domain-containing protein n=1 Tax=Prorocentrum cordatum TaxID=2364126 RepID=A0ABN9WUH9_9DINO|nr:unnamed protein product [Polarella glacialis]
MLAPAAGRTASVMRARDLQVCLVCFSRLFGQSCRLSLGGLLPMMAEELDLGPVQCASLLSAFPLGYMLMQVPGGTAADVFGARAVMAAVLLSTAGGTVLFAQLASFPTMWATVFGMGLMQGPLFPVTGVVLSKWVPGKERARATAAAELGNPLGALVALFVVPTVATLVGWRAALALLGSATAGFAATWWQLGADGPESCSIMANPAAWAVLLANTAFNFNRYFTYTWITTYYTAAWRMPVSEAAARMLWPNLADILFAVLAGQLADVVANSGRLSRVATRRVFSTAGFVGTGLSLYMAGRASDPLAVTVLVTLASGMQACHAGGFKASYTEISQEAHGGTAQLEAWRALFGVVLAVGSLGAAVYSLLLSTDWWFAVVPAASLGERPGPRRRAEGLGGGPPAQLPGRRQPGEPRGVLLASAPMQKRVHRSPVGAVALATVVAVVSVRGGSGPSGLHGGWAARAERPPALEGVLARPRRAPLRRGPGR